MNKVLHDISIALARKQGECGATRAPRAGKFSLLAGAPSATRVPGGVIVSIDLTRDRLAELRDEIDGLIGKAAPKPQA